MTKIGPPPRAAHPLVTRSMTALPVGEAASAVNEAHRRLQQARRLLYTVLDERAELPGKQPGVHGTPGGYRAHLRGGTAPCSACCEAWSWAKRRSNQRARRAA